MYVHSRILCMCILTSLLSEEVGGEGEGQAGSSHGVRVVAGPAAWLEAWICRSTHPFGGAACRGSPQCPAFVPDILFLLPVLQKWPLDFSGFLYLAVQYFPQMHMHTVIFVS